MNHRLLNTVLSIVLCLGITLGSTVSTYADLPDAPAPEQNRDIVTGSVGEESAVESNEGSVAESDTDRGAESVAEPDTDGEAEPVMGTSSEEQTEPIAEPTTESNINTGSGVISIQGSAVEPETGSNTSDSDDRVIDAEKYCSNDFDSLLCWAATASNMLWMSNYAQQAVNPVTNEVFGSEDDVFDYFRKCFEDAYGSPEAAIKYFMDGDYPGTGEEGTAQLREDAPEGGLMKGVLEDEDLQIYSISNEPDLLALLDNLDSRSAGALIKWYNTQTDRYESGAHWLTIDALIGDKDSYSGISLVDSDNDIAKEEYPGAEGDPEAMAIAAASMPNVTTEYDLIPHYIDNGAKVFWQVGGYYRSSNTVEALITWICYLMDAEKGGGDVPVVPVVPVIPDEPDDENLDGEDTSAGAQTNTLTNAQTESEMTEYLFSVLKEMMIEKNLVVFSPTGNEYDRNSDTGYILIVRRNATSLTNVFIDGKYLEPDGRYYTITMNPDGMFTITINKEYAQLLGSGEHTLTMEFSDGTVINTVFKIR